LFFRYFFAIFLHQANLLYNQPDQWDYALRVCSFQLE
jgi:hypothetical protein